MAKRLGGVIPYRVLFMARARNLILEQRERSLSPDQVERSISKPKTLALNQ